MYSRQYLSTSGQKTYTGTKSKCNCLACMKPRGLFFAQRKSPPKWALQLSSFFIRCGAGCLPVSRRQSTDDSQCAKKTYQTGNPSFSVLRQLQYLCELTHALRRCDRGTDAMHLANTPVVSPESKNPARAGLSSCLNCRFSSLPSRRSSAKHK